MKLLGHRIELGEIDLLGVIDDKIRIPFPPPTNIEAFAREIVPDVTSDQIG